MWNPDVETLDRSQMDALQLKRLRVTLGRMLANVPAARERLQAAGVSSPEDVRSLQDLLRLPFTTKDDLLDHYPFGLLAVPREQVVRIHASSGTRGKPKIVGYTRNDLAMWAEVVARSLAMSGVKPGSVVQNAYGYGLFTGGLGLHMGAELMGCTVIPISGGMTQRQIKMMHDLGSQVLCSTPSYALNIAEGLRAAGIELASLKLKLGIFGAEPWTEAMCSEIERELGIVALNIYGLSEIVGPGVSMECREGRNGSHIQEDHFLPEIIDPDTDQPVPPGQEGELVFTTLTKEALPILRYRTNDISSLSYGQCACGRTTVRMSRIRGRYDDMLIIRGVNLYPSEIERILLSVPDAAPHYQLIADRPGVLDELTLLCEPAHAGTDRELLRLRLVELLNQQTGISIAVRVLDRDQVPRSEGKAQRVVDRRRSPPAREGESVEAAQGRLN